jgi:hypothetical protein
MKRLIGFALIAAALVVPVAALADPQSSATSVRTSRLGGVIDSIDGKFSLTVRDNRGSLDRVTLHRGTFINPTGLQLEPGMPVTIIGHADGNAYDADTIDGPLTVVNRSTRRDERSTPAKVPVPTEVPDGTFETHGPSAEGGG